MNISEAVAARILELCKQYNITVNKLSTISGVTQSTVNDIVNKKARNIGISFFSASAYTSGRTSRH